MQKHLILVVVEQNVKWSTSSVHVHGKIYVVEQCGPDSPDLASKVDRLGSRPGSMSFSRIVLPFSSLSKDQHFTHSSSRQFHPGTVDE